jgi:large subunit ribosomal protein L5
MQSLETFYLKTLQYELINRFCLRNIKNIPKFKKIVLSFNYGGKQSNYKLLASSLLALELMTGQKGVITKSTSINLSLSLKKGIPVGCKLILKKRNIFRFLSKIIQEVSPSKKGLKLFKTVKLKNAFSFYISELYNFAELEKQYHMFTELNGLNITVVLGTSSASELEFVLKSLQVPIKNF